MANPNDGQIPGRPTTNKIIQQRENHICKKVIRGQLYDPHPQFRGRERCEWRNERQYHTWELNPAQKALVCSFGFHYVDSIRYLSHDLHLIHCIAERWWPERNTFQLPVGEMTVTLWDAANILGLPITGDPVYYESQLDASTLIRRYLGVAPPPDIGGDNFVKLTWLRSNFMDLDRTDAGAVDVDDLRIIRCTRAYLLSLCGSFLFSDSTENMINVQLLPHFEKLKEPTRHAWGAATLAYLYYSLTHFVGSKTHKNISGCITLLQVWSYEHFSIGRPVTSFPSDVGVFPLALRWPTEVVEQQHNLYRVLSIYRGQFDILEWHQVKWIPYTHEDDGPQIKQTSYNFSLHKYYIMHDRYTMYHPADRVLRQFGMRQVISEDPPTISFGQAKSTDRIHSVIAGWDSRFEHQSVWNMSPLIAATNEYIGDFAYRQWWGSPRMVNRILQFEEPRFSSKAVDDSSLRAFVDGITELREGTRQYLQAPGTYPSQHSTVLLQEWLDRVDRLSLGRDPDMPPLHTRIPEDYPTGTVRQRQSRRSRRGGREDTRQRDAGEGTSQQYPGEGTSQQYPGEGTSQQYPGHYAGEGTSQYYAGVGTSQYYAGVGTSQRDGGEESSIAMELFTQFFPSPSAPMPTQTQHEEQ